MADIESLELRYEEYCALLKIIDDDAEPLTYEQWCYILLLGD